MQVYRLKIISGKQVYIGKKKGNGNKVSQLLSFQIGPCVK